MAYSYSRAKATAHRLIGSFGRPQSARLRSVVNGANVDRVATIVMINFTVDERAKNGLIAVNDQHGLLSPVGFDTVPPDNETEIVVIGATQKSFTAPFTEWRIMAPPAKLDPAGVVIYYDLWLRQVR